MQVNQDQWGITVNTAKVRQRIKDAAERAGRNPEEIEIIGVSKFVGLPQMQIAASAGIRTFGESRAQELFWKQEEFPDPVSWHFIGSLQKNKVKQIVGKVDLIHSLDRYDLADALAKQSQKINQSVFVLVQVNVAEEATKHGLALSEVIPFLRQISLLRGLQIQGLMTIAPNGQGEEVRWVFQKLRDLFDQIKMLQIPNVNMRYLSMGMTNDFEIAVEEGANMVRIGTGIFGERTEK